MNEKINRETTILFENYKKCTALLVILTSSVNPDFVGYFAFRENMTSFLFIIDFSCRFWCKQVQLLNSSLCTMFFLIVTLGFAEKKNKFIFNISYSIFKYVRALFLPRYTATNLFWYKFYRHYTTNQFVVKFTWSNLMIFSPYSKFVHLCSFYFLFFVSPP